MLNFKRNKILQSKINSSIKKDVKDDSLSYVLVDKRNIHIGDNVNFNLFYNNHTEMELFLQSNSVIDKAKRKKLNDIEKLYVLESEKNKYNNFLEEHLQNILQDQTLNIDEKTEIIYTTSTELTQSLFSNPNALENAQRSKKIVAPILQSVIHNNDTIKSYIKIIEYDYYTHTHSLNVSIYALC